MEIGKIGAHQPSKKRNLHIGDNALPDPGHQHGFAIIGEPFDKRQGKGNAGDQQQQRSLARNEDAIEHRLHQPSTSSGAAGSQSHQEKSEHDAPRMRPHEIACQAPDERRRTPASSHNRRVYSHGFPAAVLEAGTRLGKRNAMGSARGNRTETGFTPDAPAGSTRPYSIPPGAE